MRTDTRKWNWGFHAWEGVVLDSLPGLTETGRSSTRMVYYADPLVAKIVLFGGKTCDGVITPCPLAAAKTWLFSGTSWTDCGLTCDAGPPSARTSEGLAYDPRVATAQTIVLFGGDGVGSDEPGSTPTASLPDTWTLDNTLHWTQCSLANCPTSSPRARGTPGMDYDPITKNVDVFGGSNSDTLAPPNRFGDTWMYNTTSAVYWKQCSTSGTDKCGPVSTICTSSTGPPCARFGHRMVWYDDGLGPTHQHMFMFGGGVPGLMNDVWFLSGSVATGAWLKCDTASEGCDPLALAIPEQRCCMGLAFDTNQKRILVFGGSFIPNPSACLDTWSWTQGSGWVLESGVACDTVP